MRPDRPTLPPPGRLVRLGIVLDAGAGPARLAEVARMCDRAGIGAVWLDDSRGHGNGPAGQGRALTVLEQLAPLLRRARLGAVIPAGRGDVASLARRAAALAAAAATADRLELALVAGDHDRAPVRPFATALAAALPAGRPTLSVEVGGAADLGWALEVADDAILPTMAVAEAAALAASLRAAAAASPASPLARQPGIALRLPVSIGRTWAEASARWHAEPAFAALGAPEEVAVFGTLEQCHERVIALAHAGVTDLRCDLPDAIDVHDVIAQVTAMTVGTLAKLTPGAPRSPAPPPPAGWGGRRPGSPPGPGAATR